MNKICFILSLSALTLYLNDAWAIGGSCAPDGDQTSTCHWDITDGVLTISGSGAMKNYWSCGVNPLCQNKASVTSVVIGDNITSVGNEAFNGFNISSINIPDSVTSIGENAFRYTAITSLTIPSHVTSIGAGAFADTDSLISVVIPSSVTTIGQSAFNHASNLASIVIEGLPTIGNFAFSNIPYGAKVYCVDTSRCTNKGKYNNIIEYQKDSTNGVYSVTQKVNGVDTTFYYSSAEKMVLGGVEEGCETPESCAIVIQKLSSSLSQTNNKSARRIYTIQEANQRVKELGGDTFTFKLKYK